MVLKTVVFVMGFYGVGKSTIVRMLADKLGIGFHPKMWIHSNYGLFTNPKTVDIVISIVGRYSQERSMGTDGYAETTWKHIFGATEISHVIVTEGYWFTCTSKLLSHLKSLREKGFQLVLIELKATIQEAKRRYYEEQKKLSEEDYDIHQKNVIRRINKMRAHVDDSIVIDASGCIEDTFKQLQTVLSGLF